MKYKNIYAAHELRMWVMTIVSAVSAAATIAAAHPEWVEAVKSKLPSKKDQRIKIIVVKEEK